MKHLSLTLAAILVVVTNAVNPQTKNYHRTMVKYYCTISQLDADDSYVGGRLAEKMGDRLEGGDVCKELQAQFTTSRALITQGQRDKDPATEQFARCNLAIAKLFYI